jgi:hypothetical protein
LHWAVQVGALKLQIKYTVDFADDVSWKATPLIAAQQLCSKDIGDKIQYSLRPILLFANMDVSTTKMCLDTSIWAKSIMDRREYFFLLSYNLKSNAMLSIH